MHLSCFVPEGDVLAHLNFSCAMMFYPLHFVIPFHSGYLQSGTLANSEDQDEMTHNAAFHQGLHCLQRSKQIFMTETHHNLEISTCDPLKYKMDNSILIVSICMG